LKFYFRSNGGAWSIIPTICILEKDPPLPFAICIIWLNWQVGFEDIAG